MTIGGTGVAPTVTQRLPSLLILVGSDHDTRLVLVPESIRTIGSSDLHLLIDRGTPYYLMHVTRNFFKQTPIRPDLLPFRTAVNLVTDGDQNPKVLSNIQKILRGFRGRIINHGAPLCERGQNNMLPRDVCVTDCIRR